MKSATFFIMVALVNVKAHNWLKYPLSYNSATAYDKKLKKLTGKNQAGGPKHCTPQPAAYTPIVMAPGQKIEFEWSNNHAGGDTNPHWIKMVPLNQLAKLKDPDDKLPILIFEGIPNAVKTGQKDSKGKDIKMENPKWAKVGRVDKFETTVPQTPGNYVYLYGWSGYRNCVQVKVDAAVNLKPTLTSAPKPTMAPKPTSKPTSPPSQKPTSAPPPTSPPTSAPPPTSKPTSAPPPTSKPTSAPNDIETLDNAAGLLRPLMIVIASASTALLA